ncbi:MAG TPA: response regulator [Bryobacteraceae bacterium]
MGAKVVVLEDDIWCTGVIVRTLQKAGYTPLAAATAEDAWSMAVSSRDSVDALIADYVLPSGNGVDAAVRLVSRFPSMKILFVSGTPLEGWAGADLEKIAWLPRHSSAFIPKPFHPSALVSTLDGLLHHAAAQTA